MTVKFSFIEAAPLLLSRKEEYDYPSSVNLEMRAKLSSFRDTDKGNKITKLIIPEGTLHINKGAFRLLSELEYINLPKSLITIGEDAFYGCSNLKEVVIPENVKEIHSGAFQDCQNLKMLSFASQSKLSVISVCSFFNTQISSIDFPASLRSIEGSAFNGCANLKRVKLNEGLVNIGGQAFEKTGINEIEIPQSVRSIGERAFMCQYLKKVKFTKRYINEFCSFSSFVPSEGPPPVFYFGVNNIISYSQSDLDKFLEDDNLDCLINVNLSGLTINHIASEKVFIGVNFSDCIFTINSLPRTLFLNCIFDNVKFYKIRLSLNNKFSGCSFVNSIFTGGIFKRQAVVSYCNFAFSTFKSTSFATDAKIYDNDFRGARCSKSIKEYCEKNRSNNFD